MNPLRVLLVDPMPAGSLQPPFPVLPLGIACIASIAQSMGADVKVLWGQNLDASLRSLLRNWQPDCAGFQTFVNTMILSHKLAQIVRSAAPKSFIVFGGVEASNAPDSALAHPAVNGVITGEGEMQFKLLLERLRDDPYSTPGLVHRNPDSSIQKNQGKCLFENLDDLPDIPYQLFYGTEAVPIGHLLTHRGCPFHCSHCPLKFRTGVPIRSHSVDRVYRTIRHLHEEFGVSHIEFYDENFTMDTDHVLGICHQISTIPVTWSCTARISQVSVDLCKAMGASGCNQIIFGLGTGVPRLQTILGTHEKLDYAHELITELPGMGIEPLAVFSMGLPTETKSEFRQTVRYALSLPECRVRFEPAAPLPGSELHKTASGSGRFLIDSWDDYLRPNQVVYIPAGWTNSEFRFAMFRAKLAARLKASRLTKHR